MPNKPERNTAALPEAKPEPLPNTHSTREEPCEWNGRILSDHHDLVNMHGGGSRCVKCKKEWLAATQEMPAPDTLQEEPARTIVKRIVTNAISAVFGRFDIKRDYVNEDGEGLNEDELIADALALALGDDIGCLDENDDDFREHIDLLWLEDLLAAPKVVDSKEDQDLSPLREDTVVFRYDGLEAITQACGLLDVIKQEWAEMWTDHDQAVREGLSRILSTSVVEQGGEQQRPGPTAGFRYKVHIETKTGWRKHNCYTQEEVFSILRGMQSDEVLVSITGPESVAPSPLPKQEFCNEVRPGFKNAKSHGCVLMAGHDEGYHCNGQNVRWNASRAAAPVGPARTDLEKGLLNALYEVMPYLKETSRYKLLAPICHEALRLAGDDWAAPVALPTHQLVESTCDAAGDYADGDYASLRCSCGRIFVGLGDEALASSRASFEAHLPEKEGK